MRIQAKLKLVVDSGYVRSVSPAGVALLGAEIPHQVIGRSILDFIDSAEQAQALMTFQCVQKSGEPASLEKQIWRRLDGNAWQARVEVVPLYWEDRVVLEIEAWAVETSAGTAVPAGAAGAEPPHRREMEPEHAMLRSIIEHAPNGILVVDEQCRVVLANARAAQITGEPIETGENYCAKFEARARHADGRALQAEEHPLRLPIKSGTVLHELEVQYTRLQDETRQLLVSAAPVLDAHSKGANRVIIIQDITRRKLAEQKLRQAVIDLEASHREVTALLRGTRSVLEYRDFTSAVKAIFEAGKELIGATAGTVALLDANRQQYEIVFSDPGGQVCSVDARLPIPVRGLREYVYKTGKAVYENNFAGSEWQKHLPAGHVPLENVLLAPLALRGEPVGLLGLANKPGGFTEMDTQLATAFAEMAMLALQNSRTLTLLEESELRFRSVAQTAVDAIITADQDGRVVFWNQAAVRVFGYTAEEMQGRTLDAILPEGLRGKHQRAYQTAVAPEKGNFTAQIREVMGQRKDGTEIPLELSMARWQSGDHVFCTSIIRDVTDRKYVERALHRLNSELEQRVSERTGALRETVSRLEAEVAFRREAEQALKESEERYRTLFEASPVGIVMTDSAGKIYTANQCFCSMTGFTADQLQQRTAVDFYQHPVERERLLAILGAAGKVDEYETPLRRVDGSFFHAAIQMNRLQIGGQDVLLTIVRDLTKRKQAEKHIQGITTLLELFTLKATRQEYLNAVVELLRDWCNCRSVGVRLFDDRGCLPYTAHVGFGRNFLKAESMLCVESDQCACIRVLQGRAQVVDLSCVNLRGSFFCNEMGRFLDQSPLIREHAGEIPCVRAGYESIAHVPIRYGDQVIGSIHLTDRRAGRFSVETIEFIEAVSPLIGEALHRFKVEESLRESESRFRAMFERHDAIMLLIEPESGLIVDANQAAARFYGYTREQLCARAIQDLSVLAPGAVADERHRALKEQRNFFIFPHQLSTGEIRTVEVHSSPIQVSGRRLLFSIIHDITERKRLEKQILDIGDLEKKRVGQDLHDSLGGSLTGLALLSKALAQTLQDSGIEEAALAQEVVDGINNAVAQTRSIARGLCPVGLGAFGLTSGLQEFAATAEQMFRIVCDFKAEGNLDIRDEVVAAHLFRIVQEAITNAVRHGKARRVAIHLKEAEKDLQLTVQDDGAGLPRHWEKSKGMGLRTMQYRSEVIGARLELNSEPGKGTVVSCVVPKRAIKKE